MADRKYAMTRIEAGDYLLLSNDASALWRICSYHEDGSAGNFDGNGKFVPLVGMFWSVWKYGPGGPSKFDPEHIEGFSEWLHWAGPFDTRREASEYAAGWSAE